MEVLLSMMEVIIDGGVVIIDGGVVIIDGGVVIIDGGVVIYIRGGGLSFCLRDDIDTGGHECLWIELIRIYVNLQSSVVLIEPQTWT